MASNWFPGLDPYREKLKTSPLRLLNKRSLSL